MPKQENFDADKYFEKVHSNSDYKAFEQIFHFFYNSLCNYALKYVKDATLAEEVVSDVFFKIWKNREQIQVASSFQHYIYRATRNQCLDYLKSRRNMGVSIDEVGFYVYDIYAESPEDELQTQELDNKIEKAIAALPQQCRLIFSMSREQGLKYREIAEKLGLSIKTVETQMGRALKALRNYLKDDIAALILFLMFS